MADMRRHPDGIEFIPTDKVRKVIMVRFTIEWKGNWEFFSSFHEMEIVPNIGDTICTEDFFEDYIKERWESKYKLEPFLLVFERTFFKDKIEISLRDPYEQEKQQ